MNDRTPTGAPSSNFFHHYGNIGDMEAQASLAKANSTLPETRHINFRIGVHVGDVMVRAGDLFDDGVNIAARLQTLAKAGGLCVSV